MHNFMDKNNKKSHKILFVSFSIFLSLFLYFGIAHASIMSDLTGGITNAVRFIAHDFLPQIKNAFCEIYVSQVQTGGWTENEIRTNVGGKLCVGYTPSIKTIDYAINISSTTNNALTTQNNPLPTQTATTSYTPQTNTPGALMGDVTAEGTNLDNQGIIYWTNIERQSNGTNLVSLSGNSILDQIALARVKDMFAKGYFAHNSPTGDSASKEATVYGYKYINLGENIALGNFGGNRKLILSWMASPGHRANILNSNYTEIGVAAMEGYYQGQKVWIAAQIFGRPLSDCKEPDSSLKTQINVGKTTLTSTNNKLQDIQSEITSMDKSNVTLYNAKVSEYNSLAKEYNELVAKLKTLIAKYNSAVQVFNSCVKSN